MPGQFIKKTDNAPPENYANSCEGMVWLKSYFSRLPCLDPVSFIPVCSYILPGQQLATVIGY
ncbi:hypothetical protein BON63_00875 [Escherichia coli]|uniref:Uncharacterized protein n=1 Tax=Shigella boydii TaxID=621 RepID=A0A9Q5U949_SHIBO|nr:hypothetical protein CHD02_25525 [Salmonella enterica subsp. enterica serovar Derby]PAY73065.1 hypothetical protein CEH00_13075 [Shigella boydii]QID22459.1 hypothetical protein [Escherichia coli]QID22957.1 hypothetical protein [Escherichia coli]QID23415.1 hypothetical protein [Escherichia coli]